MLNISASELGVICVIAIISLDGKDMKNLFKKAFHGFQYMKRMYYGLTTSVEQYLDLSSENDEEKKGSNDSNDYQRMTKYKTKMSIKRRKEGRKKEEKRKEK